MSETDFFPLDLRTEELQLSSLFQNEDGMATFLMLNIILPVHIL